MKKKCRRTKLSNIYLRKKKKPKTNQKTNQQQQNNSWVGQHLETLEPEDSSLTALSPTKAIKTKQPACKNSNENPSDRIRNSLVGHSGICLPQTWSYH